MARPLNVFGGIPLVSQINNVNGLLAQLRIARSKLILLLNRANIVMVFLIRGFAFLEGFFEESGLMSSFGLLV